MSGRVDFFRTALPSSAILLQPDHVCHQHTIVASMADIKIDKSLFQERLGHFISAWKADKRSGDALFGGASSIVILTGKSEEGAQFQKNNAMHVRID